MQSAGYMDLVRSGKRLARERKQLREFVGSVHQVHPFGVSKTRMLRKVRQSKTREGGVSVSSSYAGTNRFKFSGLGLPSQRSWSPLTFVAPRSGRQYSPGLWPQTRPG